MKLGLQLGYWGAQPNPFSIALAQEAERLEYDSVWTAEAWGSDAFTPANIATYCFRVEYTPAAGSKYLPGSHTNATTECFIVDKRPTSITTSANQTVDLGAAISDSAVLSGASSDAGGTIVFKAYGPADNNCNGTPAFTSAAIDVTGNGTYGPVTFTPDTAGTYHWIATYSGDAKNLGSHGGCGDAGENDTVAKLHPAVITVASGPVVVGGQIHDTATLSTSRPPAPSPSTSTARTTRTAAERSPSPARSRSPRTATTHRATSRPPRRAPTAGSPTTAATPTTPQPPTPATRPTRA